MAFETITQLVRSLAGDESQSGQLREDPVGLAASHGLGRPGVAALVDVDRFFETEKPILQASAGARVFSPPRLHLPVGPVSKGTLVASSDTGTLLPGPNTGSYSATGTVSHTALTPAPKGPAPTGPAAPAVPSAPGGPIAPSVPAGPAGPVPISPSGPSPWGPIPPAGPIPMAPSPFAPGGPAPQGPSAPFGPQGPSPYGWGPEPAGAIMAQLASAGCGCEAAVVAINALVAATSQASLTAIAAIAAQSRRPHG